MSISMIERSGTTAANWAGQNAAQGASGPATLSGQLHLGCYRSLMDARVQCSVAANLSMRPEVIEVGPFVVGWDQTTDRRFINYATPHLDALVTPADVTALVAAFRNIGRVPREPPRRFRRAAGTADPTTPYRSRPGERGEHTDRRGAGAGEGLRPDRLKFWASVPAARRPRTKVCMASVRTVSGSRKTS
jgi:hypothetical protein